MSTKLQNEVAGERTQGNAVILNEDYEEIGRVTLREEEMRHFSGHGSNPAKIVLSQDELDRLNLDLQDYIYVTEA